MRERSPSPEPRPARLNVWAILLGSAVDFGLTYLSAALLFVFLAGRDAAALLLGLTMTAIGGYVAATVAGRRSLAHGLGVGILSTVGAFALAWLQGGDESPLWYQVLGYGFTIPAAVLGSWVRRRFWGEWAESGRPRSVTYPNLPQAIGLLFLLLFVTAVVGLAAGFLAEPALGGRAPFRAWGIVVVLAGAGVGDALVLVWAARRARAPAGEIFPFRRVGVTGVWPALVTVGGAVILLSEATSLLMRAVSLPRVPVDPGGIFAGLEGGYWSVVIFVVLLGPVAEELLFRGVILRGFLSHYPVRKAIVASALLFGIFHVNPFQIVTATVLGAVFGWWRVATGSLSLPLLGHGLYNALVLVAIPRLPALIAPGQASTAGWGFERLAFDLSGLLLFVAGIALFRRAFQTPETPPGPSRQAGVPKTILFVCVENTFRSILSEAIFNALAPAGWRAESAGVQPAETVNPVVRELLGEIGIPYQPKTPALVTPEQIAEAERVITFGCLDRCPAGTEGKSEEWSIPGATGRTAEELRVIRDDLRRRIGILAERIRLRADTIGL